jgi:hypothetical protein
MVLAAFTLLWHSGAAPAQTSRTPAVEQRNEVSYLRGPYNTAFFDRHNRAFRIGAALHFSHARQHDVLLKTPLSEHERVDAGFDAESVDFAVKLKARTEPSQEMYAPYMARAAWRVFRAIDWTHQLHEQTYDIMASADISWDRKAEWTERSMRYYLEKNDVAFSPAPLDVTMRRAAVMMKPYFTYFRNYYPKSNNYFYAAHWWHPVIYEAQMIGGNDAEQERAVEETNKAFYSDVLNDRPQRMLLLREAAPRYSRMAPEVANAFDNLHMFHGIVYDILAYEGWTIEQQRDELYRVIKALSYQPGDERLARKFTVPRPEMDPRVYEDWLKGTEGEMSRIMMEMHEEMMPLHLPEGKTMTPEMHHRMQEAVKMKLKPGMQEGETSGSLHDAMMAVMPDMKTMPGMDRPGVTPQMMIDAMLRGWMEKHGNMPEVPPMPMDTEPSLSDPSSRMPTETPPPTPAPSELPTHVPSGAGNTHGKGH